MEIIFSIIGSAIVSTIVIALAIRQEWLHVETKTVENLQATSFWSEVATAVLVVALLAIWLLSLPHGM